MVCRVRRAVGRFATRGVGRMRATQRTILARRCAPADVDAQAPQREDRRVPASARCLVPVARAQEQRQMSAVVEGAMDAIVTIDARQRIVIFNRAAALMFGVPAHVALGGSIDQFIPARYRERHRLLVQEYGLSAAPSRVMGQPRQLVGLRADGSEFPMEASISRTGVGSRRTMTVMARDLSRQRTAEDAIAARDAAQAESRAKSALLSRVSHELRTPLNAVLGFAQLMEFNPSLDDAAREQLALMQRSGWHLVAMIDELLQLASVSSGEFALRCEETDLGETAMIALHACRAEAARRGVTLNDLQRPAEPMRAVVDPLRLKQVLLDLLSNAIKYNRPGGWVQVSLAADADEVVLTVEDDGIGMDDSRQAQLFEPFDRLGRERDPEVDTDMGLMLARELVQRMGGRMAIASQAGLGTQVRIHFRSVSGMQGA
jgi:PAS domain S-box-containing protein